MNPSGVWTHRLTSTGGSVATDVYSTTFYYEWASPNWPPYASEMAARISLLQREYDLWMFIAWCLHFRVLSVMPILTDAQMTRFRDNFSKPSVKRTGRGENARQHRIAMCLLMAAQCEDEGTCKVDAS